MVVQVQLHLETDQGCWIELRSTGESEQICSNVCKDWKPIIVCLDSVCESIYGWLSKSVDKSQFELVEHAFVVNWCIEHTHNDETKAFLSGTMKSRAQLFDLICAFLEDASFQLGSFSGNLPLSRVKAFDLTAEVRVVCVINETDEGNDSEGEKDWILYQWFILKHQQIIWQSYETDIMAVLLDLIYQRGELTSNIYPDALIRQWGAIAITPEVLIHFAKTGHFSLCNCIQSGTSVHNSSHSLSHLRITKPNTYGPWDI